MAQQASPPSVDPAIVHRELHEALERTERLGRQIQAQLADAEAEIEAIKRLGCGSRADAAAPAGPAGATGAGARLQASRQLPC
jgi:hypothetical protein